MFDLEQSFSIGDSLRDLQAAAAAGSRPILVLTGKGEGTRDEGKLPGRAHHRRPRGRRRLHPRLMITPIRVLALYLLLAIVITAPFGLFVTLAVAAHAFPLPADRRWRAGFMALCKYVLGLDYRVIGRENIPATPSATSPSTSRRKREPAGDLSAARLRAQKSLLDDPLPGLGVRRRQDDLDPPQRRGGKDALRLVVEQGCAAIRPPATGWSFFPKARASRRYGAAPERRRSWR